MKRRVLIFDNLAGGHHAQYIKHLLNYIVEKQLNVFALVCVPEEIKLSIDIEKYELSGLIKFTHAPFFSLDLGGKDQRENELILIDNLCKQYEINEVLFMLIDVYFKAIAQSKIKRSYSFKGIYINTYLRKLDKNLPFAERYKSYFRFSISSIFWLIRASRKISKIFVLSDKWAIAKLNSSVFFKKVFQFVPEPINKYSSDVMAAYNLRAKHGFTENEKVHLITGVLAPRKNISNIIDALQQLSNTYSDEKITLLMVGYLQSDVDANFKTTILNKVSKLNKEGKSINCIYEDKHLTDEELNAYIYMADVVCIPYLGYYSSSAILFQSALWQKTVLANNVGFQGYVTDKYQLGITVNPVSVQEIANGLTICLNSFSANKNLHNQFFQEYTPWPENFAANLLLN